MAEKIERTFIAIKPDAVNRGFIGEIITRFEKRGFNRIESRYMVDNQASRRVMEKSGMSFEGVLRQSLFVRDGYVDIGVCSVIKGDNIIPIHTFEIFFYF